MNNRPVRISASMLRDTLSIITVGWFDNRNLPPPTVEGYGELVEQMRTRVTRRGDLPWFVLGLRHVLATPAVAASELVNTRFAYSEREARELISYVLARLETPVTELPTDAVTLEEMAPEAWREVRDRQQAQAVTG